MEFSFPWQQFVDATHDLGDDDVGLSESPDQQRRDNYIILTVWRACLVNSVTKRRVSIASAE
jgi:hypothetical protein